MVPAKVKALSLLAKALQDSVDLSELSAMARHIETLGLQTDKKFIDILEKKFRSLKNG